LHTERTNRVQRAAPQLTPLCVLTHGAPPDSSLRYEHPGNPSGIEATTKRTAVHTKKLPDLPIAWRETQYVAWRETEYADLRTVGTDTCDDRASTNIFDVDDEQAEVAIIVGRLKQNSL